LERKKRKRGGEGFFVSSPLEMRRPPALSLSLSRSFSRISLSHRQRAGRNITLALPSILARKLRSLRPVPPPIGRSKKGGGEEEREQAAFFPSCSFRRLSFPRRPDVETREKEKKEVEKAKEVASRRKKNAGPLGDIHSFITSFLATAGASP